MTAKQYVEAPAPILVVLNAALRAMSKDKRFTNVEGGHYDVSWCQPSKTKGDERPARYRITVECGFVPERS